ncbi:MAG: TadE/TadG family type IV pilus assembly protein [Capsulimonas sp.]|uniref:TadE/TadG family type IV pilus assembly protein n=1 Tax=Capsulimonas sp. TaxID=2494211 RepID=UPI003263EA32
MEMALCLPLLIWLTFAIIEYGIVINTTMTLTQLARDTARFVAIHGGETNADAAATVNGSIRAFLKAECAGQSINYSDLTVVIGTMDAGTGVVTANAASARLQGNVQTVQISYFMGNKISVSAKLVPGLSSFTDNTKPVIKKSSVISEKAPG